jgi:hypothetical protein
VWRSTTSRARTRDSASSDAPHPALRPGLERLELRFERLRVAFRFTYAFHAREVRFERDAGDGFVRVFPETFSFRPERCDPAELYLQLDDLARKPRLLSPRARRRDSEVLLSRLLLALPRHLERVLDRIEAEARLAPRALDQVYEEVALLAQIVGRFVADRGDEEGPGIRVAALHLRKLAHRALFALVRRRVDPAFLAAWTRGEADAADPADDLSEAGFFATFESGEPAALDRSLVRLAQRAFHRWLEDVCLDESNRAFEVEDSPFEDREREVLRAICGDPAARIERASDLTPFLRRRGDRDCLRVLAKLEGWFLRQYDVDRAAALIHHRDRLARGRAGERRVLSHHRARNYLLLLALLVAPYVGAAAAYERWPRAFDLLCSAQLLAVDALVIWFLFWRFCWRRNLTVFEAALPRVAAGIIVGYLPIFFIDEVWSLAARSAATVAGISVLLGMATLLYLYIEVQRRLGDADLAFARARQIFALGVLQAFGVGLVLTSLLGPFMAMRNWSAGGTADLASLRGSLAPLVGQLPEILGMPPLLVFPAALGFMTFLSFFIGTFLQLMWEDIPITEPL